MPPHNTPVAGLKKGSSSSSRSNGNNGVSFNVNIDDNSSDDDDDEDEAGNSDNNDNNNNNNNNDIITNGIDLTGSFPNSPVAEYITQLEERLQRMEEWQKAVTPNDPQKRVAGREVMNSSPSPTNGSGYRSRSPTPLRTGSKSPPKKKSSKSPKVVSNKSPKPSKSLKSPKSPKLPKSNYQQVLFFKHSE